MANLPVADVAAVVGVSDDEVTIGAGIVDDADVVVDVDDDEMEADIIGDFSIGVGVDEDVEGSVVDADQVIAEPLFLSSLFRSAYSALICPVSCMPKSVTGSGRSQETNCTSMKKSPLFDPLPLSDPVVSLRSK